MAQSVELTFDPAADAQVIAQWRALADARLPTAQRITPSEHHRPHVTLFAGDSVDPAAEVSLPALLAGLDLTVQVGALMVFGPRRTNYVLVRQVVPSAELIALQASVAELCGANRYGQFGPGRWSPHVTLAPRIAGHQVGAALEVLGATSDAITAEVTQCRRWDGDRRTAWWLTG
ncbi:MAG TPA: 2'-5' RNA ligase family protein [Propionibacteriaceae bacterium]